MLRAGHSAWHTEREREKEREKEQSGGVEEEGERERGHLDEESKFTERKAASSVKAHGSRPSSAQTALTTNSNRGQRLKTAECKGDLVPPSRLGTFCRRKERFHGGGGERAKQGAETGKGTGERSSSGRGPEVWILLRRPKQESLASADKPRLEHEGDNCRPWAGLGAADGQIQRPCGVGAGG